MKLMLLEAQVPIYHHLSDLQLISTRQGSDLEFKCIHIARLFIFKVIKINFSELFYIKNILAGTSQMLLNIK